MYLKVKKYHHINLHATNSGLVINPKWPFMGISPDAILERSCCGRGILEIKSHRHERIQDATQDKSFNLKGSDGTVKMDGSHAYYYHVQTQIFICDADDSFLCL